MADERERTPDAATLQQVFRDLPLPIAICNLDGELEQQNDAHEAFANALGDAAGIGLFSALDDLRSERGGHRAHFLRATRGEVVDYAFIVSREPATPGAKVLHFRRLLMPAGDVQRRTMSVVSVLLEVTDWVYAERDKARLQEELQRAQRTEALGLLASSIAHDFNNLLVGVLGNVSLLLDELDQSSTLVPVAQAIELSARRAADVARQLLAYAGKGQFRVEELDLSELARETSELLRITIGQRTELRMELSSTLALVQADATQMRQVVMNLITNARDAVGQAGHITLRTGELPASQVDFTASLGSPDSQASSFVYLEVEDTGTGMDSQTAARVFDPFFTTKASGHGLGLSSVLGIVRRHGGAISVVSAPGQGTKMRVLLPARGRPAGTLAPSRGAPHDLPSPRGGHVLVADDEEPVRALLETMLRKLGYTVTSVVSTREALRALERAADATNAVVLDLTMPDQDGGDAFARIRERHPKLPVILMSGYDVQAAPSADGFLHKPFTLDQLRQVFSDVLGRDAQTGRPPD